MDYKELIERLKYYGTDYATGGNLGREIMGTDDVLLDAATAIETLLAERDAAVEIISSGGKRCRACVYNDRGIHDFPCCHCRETGGMTDYWEWRGPQKGDVNG